MMKKEIRKIMNLLEAVSSGASYDDGVSDLKIEGGDNPSMELAQEIADEYSIDPEILMKRFRAEQERQENIKKVNPENTEKQRQADRESNAADIRSKVNPGHVQAVEEFVDTIQTPEGYEREEGKGHMDMTGEVYGKGGGVYDPVFTDEQHHVHLKSDDVEIIVNVSFAEEKVHPKSTLPASVEIHGHTNYKSAQGWRTFSRRGIDDSFHIGHYGINTYPSKINEVVQQEIQKAKEAIVRSANMVLVPGLPDGFTVNPNDVPAISAKLKGGETHDFMPGGMGTGYTLSIKPLHPPMAGGFNPSPKGPPELARFFGVSNIYVTQQDHD